MVASYVLVGSRGQLGNAAASWLAPFKMGTKWL
jgi:hypothetical protein